MKARRIRNRKTTAKTFVSAIHWIGMTIVLAFLLWAVAMLIWQAVEQLKQTLHYQKQGMIVTRT